MVNERNQKNKNAKARASSSAAGAKKKAAKADREQIMERYRLQHQEHLRRMQWQQMQQYQIMHQQQQTPTPVVKSFVQQWDDLSAYKERHSHVNVKQQGRLRMNNDANEDTYLKMSKSEAESKLALYTAPRISKDTQYEMN